jgi:hypothetical protein
MIERLPGLPDHRRWTRNGGRRVNVGDVPGAGEVFVTGRGTHSHRSMSCQALRDGRARAIANGWASGGFYAVSGELASQFVNPCRICWSEPPETALLDPWITDEADADDPTDLDSEW